MDLETAGWAGAGVVLAVAFGRFILPLLNNMLQNAVNAAAAQGNLVQVLQAERDQWKTHAAQLDATLQTLRSEFSTLRSKFDLMEYQLNTALDELRRHREGKA